MTPNKSATHVDIALLVSALFLQRFSLPFGTTRLHLDFVAIGLILLYQFLSGRLHIAYDRLLWFLPFALANTCSLLLNFKSTMLTSYSQFLILFSLFTLNRPSTLAQYRKTLQAFQLLVMLLSCLAIVQLPAQFVVNGKDLINFYGIVPNILLGGDDILSGGENGTYGYNTAAILPGTGLYKSNGIFLNEPSFLSQTVALAILIEVLEFRRPRYLLVMTLGFLVAFSGTGLMLLLLFLPLAGLRHGRAGLSALLIVMFALGLFATGIIDLSHFTSRIGEFEAPGSSGFGRFVQPFVVAAKEFDIEALQSLLVGSGPGTAKTSTQTWYGQLDYMATWVKLFHEYGIIGSLILACFLASCLRRSRCPGLVVAAQIFTFLFLQGIVTIIIALCTLSGPEPRRGRIDETSQYRSSLIAGEGTV